MSTNNEYIVVVERDDMDPLIVGFELLQSAEAWVIGMNNLMEFTFPSSFHMYSRPPVRPMLPENATAMMIEDAVVQLEADREESNG